MDDSGLNDLATVCEAVSSGKPELMPSSAASVPPQYVSFPVTERSPGLPLPADREASRDAQRSSGSAHAFLRVKCANRECNNMSGQPEKPRSIYCSKRCQSREQNLRQNRIKRIRHRLPGYQMFSPYGRHPMYFMSAPATPADHQSMLSPISPGSLDAPPGRPYMFQRQVQSMQPLPRFEPESASCPASPPLQKGLLDFGMRKMLNNPDVETSRTTIDALRAASQRLVHDQQQPAYPPPHIYGGHGIPLDRVFIPGNHISNGPLEHGAGRADFTNPITLPPIISQQQTQKSHHSVAEIPQSHSVSEMLYQEPVRTTQESQHTHSATTSGMVLSSVEQPLSRILASTKESSNSTSMSFASDTTL